MFMNMIVVALFLSLPFSYICLFLSLCMFK
jgi:hypothetical protein